MYCLTTLSVASETVPIRFDALYRTLPLLVENEGSDFFHTLVEFFILK